MKRTVLASSVFLLHVACTLIGLAPKAWTDPCTLYKADDVRNARENAKRHPWAGDLVESWKRSVSFAMEQDPSFFEDMITELTNWPTYGQNCPACVGKKSSMGECGLYNWSVKDPDKLICKYCGTVYPNPDYPETGSMTCPKMGQTFTYYETEEERAHPGENPSPYAFRWVRWPVHTSWTGVLRAKKTGWCMSQILPLAKLYAITGEVPYAERCALIMDRFAQVYPHWLFHSYNGTYADCPPAEAAANLGKYGGGGRFPKETIIDPFERHQAEDHAKLCNGFWGAGRFGCSGGDGGSVFQCVVAYDLIKDAQREDGSPVMTPIMEERIRQDLLLAACEDSMHWKDINNKCGKGRSLSAAVGVLWGHPEKIEWAMEGFRSLMSQCFHFDGFCRESPSYSGMHLNLMGEIPEVVRDNPVLELDPFRDVGRYRLALESMVRMLAPDRKYPVIGDTHSDSGPGSRYVEILADRYGDRYAGLLETVQKGPLSEKGSEYALWYRRPDLQAAAQEELPLRTEWFPGWHVGVLRAQDPQGPTALYLNGNAYHGHRHHDTLGIMYYAFGQEVASDRGYIWDDPRNAWTKGTLSHNIVTVDGENQRAHGRTSVLELFCAAPCVEMVQARTDNAYPQCDRYQRTCVLVPLGKDETYAVDFFRVSGGALHQYGFQCNGQLLPPEALELEAADAPNRWLSRCRAATPRTPLTLTWEHGEIRMDLLLLSPMDRLLVADAPGWRSDAGSQLNAPPIHQVFAERVPGEGQEKLKSEYVAVMAPYKGTVPVKGARLLKGIPEEGCLAVEVDRGDGKDIVISCLDQEERAVGPVKVRGRFAFVSLDEKGRVRDGCLVGGTRLQCADEEIELPEAERILKVDRVENGTLHLKDPVPPYVRPGGAYLLLADTGFDIESFAERSITVRDYPLVDCDTVTVVSYGAM